MKDLFTPLQRIKRKLAVTQYTQITTGDLGDIAKVHILATLRTISLAAIQLFFMLTFLVYMVSAEDLTIYTENYAPFNYEENGVVKGLNVELLIEVLKRANIDKTPDDIILTSWARGYKETQRRKNSLLFTAARTPQREKLFKWVGPIGASHMALIARTNRNIDLKSNGFNAYKYASMKDVRGEQALLTAGTKPNNILHVNSTQSAAHLLARGRVDAWAYDRIVSFWVLQTLGYDPKNFKVIHSFNRYNHYFAFNKDTNSNLIERLQHALDTIQEDGTHAALIEKYTGVLKSGITPDTAR